MPGDVGITLPRSWRRRSDPDHGVLISARTAAVPPSGVRPELVLRCTPVDAPLRAWRDVALGELAARLPDFELEDADEYDLHGHPVLYHRFAHRGPTADLVSEQWSWVVGTGRGRAGVTLTGTSTREDYPDWCEVFESVAATVDVSGLVTDRDTGAGVPAERAG
ncbi:hypothetical protein [Nocardioides ferulae]|uniref:hypothetical protein n=1 Tax=Nocardioides ferulae TaxID=2340821 RepID=UPI000EB56E85|nr:hypothetical protein [Nocardioides ferulae]